jgi:DNA-binding transcriptional LysR family regulator
MTDPDWQHWRAFLAVVQTGSLSAAARQLRLTQPTLGRQIAALERDLGVALFTRSTEGVHPTDAARELVPHATAMASAAAALLRAASGGDGALRGSVRLAASEFIGAVVLPPMLARFRAANPLIEIELALSDRVEDLSRRDADIAVRNTTPTQAALLVRRIGEVPITLFAHRAYVEAHGMPADLTELERHGLIGRPEHLLQFPSGGIALRFGFRCSSDLGLLAALRAGLGIGYCQTPIGRDDPDLVPVLPDTVLARIGVWLVTHEDLRGTRRIRVLADHLAGELTRYVAGVG